MAKIRVEKRTVHGALKGLDSLFSPGTTKFSDYVKMASDFHGFLRTVFANIHGQKTPPVRKECTALDGYKKYNSSKKYRLRQSNILFDNAQAMIATRTVKTVTVSDAGRRRRR